MEKVVYMMETLAYLHEVLGRTEDVNFILMNSVEKETSSEPKVKYFLLNHLSEQRI